MRLLSCFTKRPVVMDTPQSIDTSRSASSNGSIRRAATANAPQKGFVPVSIPELHPEYAHSEPYCFAAKTDSARQVVDRARVARGQAPMDRVAALREQGVVVVRGPTHSAKNIAPPPVESKPEPLVEQVKARASVPLQVEQASTINESFVESDDNEENVDANVQRRSKASRSLKEKGRGKRSVKPKERVSRKGKTSSTASTPVKEAPVRNSHAVEPRRSDASEQRTSDASSTRASDFVPGQGRTYSSSDAGETEDSVLQEAMTRTPPALLAPIVVPRMSAVIDEPPRLNSPSVSMDSWVQSDSAARFDDIEEEYSSGLLTMSPFEKQKAVHKAANNYDRTPIPRENRHDIPPVVMDDALFQSSAALNGLASLRSKRKSMPFAPSFPGYESGDPDIAPESAYSGSVPSTIDDCIPPGLGAIPKANLLRQISSRVSSDEIQVVDTSTHGLCQIPPPSMKNAAKQRVEHDELDYVPRKTTTAAPQGIMRRASTGTKRKTVSFHDEAPIIIEPNLRAPSKSLPRNVMLSRESDSESKGATDAPLDSFSAMRVRDSVKLTPSNASSAAPTMDIPRRTNRELSDSSGAEENFAENFATRSSRRVSRVSVRDKVAIREASKRQSQAVAKAMSQQIRGVPRSAMLAYADNEVVLSDDPLDENGSSSSGRLSFRRRSSKSIRMPPRIESGKVPLPPPPPPFVPETSRVRSVRAPPPPPRSPMSS